MKWKVLSSEILAQFGYFKLRKDRCEMPDGRIMPGYYTMEFSDWVNVVPVTSEGKIILIKQYRHSVEETIVEIPGGSVDPRNGEPIEMAAFRELQEETGYTPEKMEYIGFHYPNPALLNNKMHTYIAWNCKKTQNQSLDPYEDIEVFEVTKIELLEKINSGEISHSIILASLLKSLGKISV